MTNEMLDDHSETVPAMHTNLRMPALHRVGFIVAGAVGITLLIVAFRLKPNPKGYGTHQQLGLTRCSFIEFFGIQCPSCGMTTSWSNLMNGRIIQSFRANPGGALLGICTIVFAPWLFVSGLIGRWFYRNPNMAWLFFGTLGICAVTTIQWVIRVTFFPL